MQVALIGTGRVARVLAPALRDAGVMVSAIAGRDMDRAAALAELAGAAAAPAPQDAVLMADLVLLAVPDDAIEGVCRTLTWRPGVACVHLSGATELGALNAAAEAGARVGGLHPLVAFAAADAARAALPGAVWGVEAPDEALRRELEFLVARLGGRTLTIPAGGRAVYHAAANYAAAFMVTLLAEATRLWAQLGVDEVTARTALVSLARGALGGVARAGVVGALPGPLARGDVGTVEQHVAALEARAPEQLELYRQLSRAALRIAEAQGLDAQQARRVRDVLAGEEASA